MEKMFINPIASIDKIQNKNYIIDISIDSKGVISVLSQEKKTESPESQCNPDNVVDIYDVYEMENNHLSHKFKIKNQDVDFNYLRRINNEKYLITSARCRFYSEDNIEKNALIINSKGKVLDKFTLGDGIEDIKVEKESIIWTSYFDEGIFGNYGWINPLGTSGLRSWSLKGEPLYEYKAPDYDHAIFDCYAFNIDKENNKWFYFYTEFYLGKLNDEVKEYYAIDVEGASVLAIGNDYIITDCGYTNGNTFILHKENSESFKPLLNIGLFDELTKNKIEVTRVQFCEDTLVILSNNNNIYKIRIDDILTEFNII